MRLDDPGQLAELAERLARGAGELVREARAAAAGRLEVDSKTTPTDLVTEVDRASERWLLDRLGEERPDDAVLGEEGADRAGGSGVRWLLDPIDGTVNFLYGVPQYSVSVAAEVGGEVVAGCVHHPPSGETFTAVRGGGARLDGRPIGGSWRAPALETALLGTGFAYDQGVRSGQGRVLAGVLPRVANVRRLGSAALDLCFVGAGRLDCYYEHDLKPWDRAAGALVAAEAGAVVHELGRTDGIEGPAVTMAASPAVAAELRTLLEELGAADV